ncbi:non-hydrolyzing UDP-N-acetylglucosamine 2-epimerase [Azospirillum agricola]|uniref:non-hydrolyzing UDP-N-acetylglucosamine 2-epimerase n=1 Tax=Azospirillum agricola TaxID=1720247 RepID=UPI000A0F1ACB|nr:UDP-N-acetylglucosamine 2-epimerase (non-hydrolyzing) [Azospirillum agricola]SMH41329.1 UDP-N-Acetylglucosamine 2-epimerase [Azospirillum lipoferum]
MTKILVVVGTRPEAIKMAPLIERLRADPDIRTSLCVTGQHRTMVDGVFELFGIRPDLDLDLMKPGQTLTDITAGTLRGLELVLERDRPDRILVHGDTTTAMAAGLAGFYARIPVAHVEAGLRTGNLQAPWPEEMNRCFIDLVADRLFAPTESARRNLLAEGRPDSAILVTGNTVVDALLATRERLRADTRLREGLEERFTFLDAGRQAGRAMVLVTAHRRESFGEGFRRICEALARLGRRDDVDIVYPVHLNPNVSGPVRALLGGWKRIHLIEPVDYRSFVHLLDRCAVVLTDSGGVQEEAPSFGKPVLVMRDETERREAVEAGVARLVGSDPDAIVAACEALLDRRSGTEPAAVNPFGDGLASRRILTALRAAHGLPAEPIAPFRP